MPLPATARRQSFEGSFCERTNPQIDVGEVVVRGRRVRRGDDKKSGALRGEAPGMRILEGNRLVAAQAELI